jgi:hypothetical protein
MIRERQNRKKCSKLSKGLLYSLAVAYLALSMHSVNHSRFIDTKGDFLHPEELPWENITLHEIVPVFYNLFLSNETDTLRVQRIVNEQLEMSKTYHQFFVHSIGVNMTVPKTVSLKHHDEGSELITLQSLWTYCRKNPQRLVVYLHSKGSYSATASNEKFRRFLTVGALSDKCSNLTTSTCNVCSTRMSPLPHPHVPGNMWSAQCSYIQRLIDPIHFPAHMDKIESRSTALLPNQPKGEESCLGVGRFAAEHWVLSHPDNKPCDLYTDPSYTWSYGNIPDNLSAHFNQLAKAPRFDLKSYVKKNVCVGRGTVLQKRLNEYMKLYGRVPDELWWGWDFFNKSYAQFLSQIPKQYHTESDTMT